MICVICKKEIDEKKEDYFKVDLIIKGKLFGTDYSHKNCWMERNRFEQQLGNLVGGLTDYAEREGFIEKKEEIVI